MTPAEIEYGELPLQVLSGGGHVGVYDANGAEVVAFMEQDWRDEPLLMVPRMASCLKQAYEEPTTLLEMQAVWMKDQYEDRREMWTDGENGPYWFDPEPLPSVPSEFSEDDIDGTVPLRVIVDDDAPGPEEPDDHPDHEIRTVDADDCIVYQMHADEYRDGIEPVAELIEAIRLTYEEPLELLQRNHQ